MTHDAWTSNQTQHQSPSEFNPLNDEETVLLDEEDCSSQRDSHSSPKRSHHPKGGKFHPEHGRDVSEVVEITIDEPLCSHAPHQRSHSFGIWEVANDIPTLGTASYPFKSPALALVLQSPHLELYRMSEDYGRLLGFGTPRTFTLPTQAQRLGYYEEDIPQPAESPNFSPEEVLRIFDELGAICNLQGLQSHRDLRAYTLRELSWLHGQERRLLEDLGRISLGMRDFHDIGCLGIDHLSIFETSELDEYTATYAKNQLDLYNKRRGEIQAQSVEATKKESQPTLPSIPWPTLPPAFRGPFDFQHNSGRRMTETQAWKLTTHTFFVEAFGLHPLLTINENNELIFDFVSEDGRSETVAKLKGLRDQIKLEKVRWHEDKMKVLFGQGAATNELVKAVWSAVINLKGRIDQSLEVMQN